MMIERDEFEPLIPHSGLMCLLDRVLEWDSDSIQCTAVSHFASNNPLRSGAQLSAIHLVEYAAQSMAIHGALLARVEGKALAPGYLAGVKEVQLKVNRLDDIRQTLYLCAEPLVRQCGSMLYQFRSWAERGEIGCGRITVIESQPII